MHIILAKENGAWPSVRFAIGSEVVCVEVRREECVLAIQLLPTDCELIIPPPWNFTSCLMAINSADKELSGESLIGLHGATLTGVEEDSDHLDLLFGSIKVSLGKGLSAAILSRQA